MVSSQPSSAALLTTDPGTDTTTVFTSTGNNGFGNPGPVVLDGFTWTGNPQVTFGNTGYGLGSNGVWSPSANFSWIATNNSDGSITVNLGGLFGLVGGFMNYSPNSFFPDATITALAADGVTALETYDLVTLAPISTPGGTNAGAFRGISRGTNDIGFFRLSGSFILAHTLEIGEPAAVPEPSTLSLIGLGLVGLGAMRKRRLYS